MIQGIDISSYNTTLNQAVLTDMLWTNKLYFVFVKASEGVTLPDPKFTVNWNMSRKAGLVCGAYHFLRPLSDVNLQVQNFVNQYKKVNTAGVLPPVVDMEWAVGAQNKTDQWTLIPASKRIPILKTFLLGIEIILDVKPIIYTAYAFWNDLILSQASDADKNFFAQYALWIVDLQATGKIPTPWNKALFTQYHFGEAAKDKSNPYDICDQDFFNGSLLELLNSTSPGFTVFKGFPKSIIVRDIQQSLFNKNFYTGVVNGDYDNATEQAVKNFQTSAGLLANGIVDAQSWNKLLA